MTRGLFDKIAHDWAKSIRTDFLIDVKVCDFTAVFTISHWMVDSSWIENIERYCYISVHPLTSERMEIHVTVRNEFQH